jgi:flavoprotein
MAQGMTSEQLAATGQVPVFMIPSDEEAALIKDNMDAIMKAMAAIQ